MVYQKKLKEKSDFLSFQKIDFFYEVRFDCAGSVKTRSAKVDRVIEFYIFWFARKWLDCILTEPA